MKAYKVIFDNNIAVSAFQINLTSNDNAKIDRIGNKPVLRYLTVYADDEQDSLDEANKIVRDYFRFLKPGNA